MTQPLNYTPKAIEALLSHPCTGAPATATGNRYIAAKLRDAQVFVLSDAGELLDRSKPRPEVPGNMLRPPFPCVALEYSASDRDWAGSPYPQVPSSRRIALAWESCGDLPAALRSWCPPNLGPGVIIASICYHDAAACWLVVPMAVHVPYEETWHPAPAVSPFRDAMIKAGRIPKAVLKQPTLGGSYIALSPETIVAAARVAGGVDAVADMLGSDVMDEVNAYFDLCCALACRNVSTVEHAAPERLNRQRIAAGKLPLKSFHVLQLSDGSDYAGGVGSDRNAPRAHLRRGHIRRIAPDRVTWVNQTMVRGRGFVDKVYAL